MTGADRAKWDNRYSGDDHWHGEFHPSEWLTTHVSPSDNGVALDIACGTGHNTVWLAGHGYRVAGIDGSWVGLKRAIFAAQGKAVLDRVKFVQADLDNFRPAPKSADLIAVMRFLNRELYPSIIDALKPDGWLVMETFNLDFRKLRPDIHPAFLLNHGEWREAFRDLKLVGDEEKDGVSYFAAIKT